MKVSLFLTVSLLFFTNVLAQQTREEQLAEIRSLFNYEESRVPDYVLPNPLALTDNKKVKSIIEWEKIKRPEDAHPVDQHQLIALIAPRPVYIASAEEEIWADTRGEYLSGYYAAPIYQLYGLTGLTSERMPAVNQPVVKRIGYYIRSGKHDVTL